MFLVSLVFAVVYVCIAALGPKVWLFTRSPGMRLVGVLGVQLLGISVGLFAASLFVPTRQTGELAPVRGYVGFASAKVVLIPILTVALSMLAAIVHWSKHARDDNALARAREGPLGSVVVEISSDRVRAELRRREELEAGARRATLLRSELAELVREREVLERRPVPSGDPASWSTQALRDEVNRQEHVRVLRGRIATLDAELLKLAGVGDELLGGESGTADSDRGVRRTVDEAERKRRLASIQEWVRRQQS